MSLTENQKVEIINALHTRSNFNRQYTLVNRNWFIRHMIEHYSASGVADAMIRNTVRTFIDSCKTIVNAKRNFTIGVNFSTAIVRSKLRRRVEVVYGALAAKPELAQSANENLLDFIIKRRYRAVMRMDYFVNPNSGGYFRYPKTCSTNTGYQVNEDANTFWVAFNYLGRFFKLSPPNPNPPQVLASFKIDKLFTRKSDPCLGNLLDCARVLSVVFMDTLFEAINKDTLFIHLESKPDFVVTTPPPSSVVLRHPHLSICHVNSDVNAHFIMDSTSEGLFSKLDVPATDLQVGDHVYIYNHPLYKVFNPNGSWRGEHALVYDLENRNYRSSSGFMFGGHGKEGTLYQFYSAFMQELKTHLERAYKIGKVHLEFLQSVSPVLGSNALSGGGTVTVANASLNIAGTIEAVILFEYQKTIRYSDYERNGARQTVNRFVIVQPKQFAFWIDDNNTNAAVIAAGRPTIPIPIQRRIAPASGATRTDQYDPEFYSIPYRKEGSANVEFYDLFRKVNGSIRIRQIRINDLFADPFSVVPGTSDLKTTQPKVDVSTSYQTFLRAKGAIN